MEVHLWACLLVRRCFGLLQIKLARSAHLRLKTLKHPNVLRYLDGIEVSHTLLHCIHFSNFGPERKRIESVHWFDGLIGLVQVVR